VGPNFPTGVARHRVEANSVRACVQSSQSSSEMSRSALANAGARADFAGVWRLFERIAVMTRRLITLAALAAISVTIVTGTAHAKPTWPSRSTAISSTRGWFQAINDHDRRRLLSYVATSARDQMGWAQPDAKWSRFTHLRYRVLPASNERRAIVYCSFHESASPTEGNPDSFWDVYLRHTSAGWLVASYGQG
jgi:hypothetical protein